MKRSVNDRPWYHKGLRFRCTGCGHCCTGDPGYVWVNHEEIEALAAAIGVEVAQFVRKYTRQIGNRTSLVEFPNGDCVFFDTQSRRCTVYQRRPRQCRTWPFWESNLGTPSDWAETGRICPGIGKGPLVPPAQIESQVRVIRV